MGLSSSACYGRCGASRERQFYAIDVGLAFVDALSDREVEGYLRARIAALEEALGHIGEHRAEQLARPEMPPAAAAVFDHALAHTRAELEWTRNLLAGLGKGEGVSGRFFAQ